MLMTIVKIIYYYLYNAFPLKFMPLRIGGYFPMRPAIFSYRSRPFLIDDHLPLFESLLSVAAAAETTRYVIHASRG